MASTMAILTPSFRGDLGHFAELHRSVLRCTDDDVVHHAVVPDRDVALFEQIASPRLCVTGTSAYLPRRFVSTYAAVGTLRRVPPIARSIPKIEAVNVRRPWPPIRGWVLQQLVKLEAVARAEADVVVLADSDIVFFRHFGPEDFIRDGVVRFYRSADPLTPDLVRHAIWSRVARRLLGLPSQVDETDYVSSLLAWDPGIARRIQMRVEESTAMPWEDALAREIHFSEWMLYGCYVDNLGSERDRSFTTTDTRCLSYWDTTPLDERGVAEFVAAAGPEDVAVLVQSASRTSPLVRQRVIESLCGIA
jgi:hypothetical protein